MVLLDSVDAASKRFDDADRRETSRTIHEPFVFPRRVDHLSSEHILRRQPPACAQADDDLDSSYPLLIVGVLPHRACYRRIWRR